MSLDVFYLLIVVLAVIKGLRRGLVVGVFSILAFIVGLAAALKLSAVVAQQLQNGAGVQGPWLPVLSFGLVFVAVAILVSLLARLVDKVFDMALLGWVNALGGVLLYTAIYTILFSVLLFFAEHIGLVKPETIAGSTVYPYVQPWGPVVMNNLGKVVPLFKDMFAQLEGFFDGLAQKAS